MLASRCHLAFVATVLLLGACRRTEIKAVLPAGTYVLYPQAPDLGCGGTSEIMFATSVAENEGACVPRPLLPAVVSAVGAGYLCDAQGCRACAADEPGCLPNGCYRSFAAQDPGQTDCAFHARGLPAEAESEGESEGEGEGEAPAGGTRAAHFVLLRAHREGQAIAQPGPGQDFPKMFHLEEETELVFLTDVFHDRFALAKLSGSLQSSDGAECSLSLCTVFPASGSSLGSWGLSGGGVRGADASSGIAPVTPVPSDWYLFGGGSF